MAFTGHVTKLDEDTTYVVRFCSLGNFSPTTQLALKERVEQLMDPVFQEKYQIRDLRVWVLDVSDLQQVLI